MFFGGIVKTCAKWNSRYSGCTVICFANGRIQHIVGVRFIEPDITGLMNQAPTNYDTV